MAAVKGAASVPDTRRCVLIALWAVLTPVYRVLVNTRIPFGSLWIPDW